MLVKKSTWVNVASGNVQDIALISQRLVDNGVLPLGALLSNIDYGDVLDTHDEINIIRINVKLEFTWWEKE